MTDYPKALAALRESLANEGHRATDAIRDYLAALDAQEPSGFAYRYRDALAGGTVIRFNTGHEVNGSRPIEAVPYWLGAPPAPVAPAAAVPEGGLRDSVLNSAKFRASCYALVGIVEGIQGLGRCWAANGERLKDTREWVAFYNCVASMRNGTFNQASAEQAQQPAGCAVVPDGYALVPVEPTGEMIEAGIMFGNSPNKAAIIWQNMLAATPAQQPAAAVPAANVTPMRQPRTDLARLVESINAAVYANGDGLSVTEAIGALELAKLELLKEQEQ